MARLQTINIKGKEYVMVKDRILAFHEGYKSGSITTEILADDGAEIIIRASVYPDASDRNRVFTGIATGIRGGEGVDKASAVENAETSAVGRALGMLGIGVLEGIATIDEIGNAQTREKINDGLATEKQLNYIDTLVTNLGKLPDHFYDSKEVSREKVKFLDASKWIAELKRLQPK